MRPKKNEDIRIIRKKLTDIGFVGMKLEMEKSCAAKIHRIRDES